ncbi:MFS transporter [Bdellovibrio bacteriovorus]|uniref:Major facilitator transporter n=1 Tax=Bdellovibrio bacteriovorus str. Tiberius TaxID=1069642 RepID=K7Z7R0_BDEBC|nr:MFS transporter [Bdellovibrio bacteriovorus]AFY00369.1 major facilitator transporter [Bdellovibrio bacteriovorus str. Tiberius]
MGKGLSRTQVFFMTLTCILVVGNMYYNQPLLGILAREFGVTESKVSLVPAFTLIGYALGILFLVPMGDMIERRKLIQGSMTMAGLLAIALPFSPTLGVFCAISCVMGFFNVSQSVLIPFAANLAKPEERGKVVGIVLSGILIGSLMARTLAGFIAQYFGWKTVFIFAGAVSLILSIVSQFVLPMSEPNFKGTYKQLLLSTAKLFRELPTMREAALMGAILFGTFSAFWTTLTFLLEAAPFNYDPKTIGLFGALGMIGALAAPLAGRYADKKGAAATIRMGLYCSMGAFALLALSSTFVAGIVLGVLVLDLGIQVAHISNQSRVFSHAPEYHSRLNTIYIFAYFTGGSLGSYVGSALWSWGQWPAVSLGGLGFCLIATLIFRRGQKNRAAAAKIA